jgi:hypothetical protein
VFFISNIIYIRVPLICFKSYHHQNFENLLESSRSQAGLVPDIVTQPSFSSWIIDIYLLE